MSNFRGVYPVVLTPFKENGDIDFALLEARVDWLIENGVHGLIPNGSTGEYAAMSREEQKQVIKCVCGAAKGRVPVIAGVTAETAKWVIEMSEAAKEYGADGLMALPSPYNNPTQEEIYNHFKTIAEAVDLPIMVYNNPWSTGVDISVNTLARLSQLPNIEYCKECTGNVRRQRQLLLATDYKLKIFSGWDDLCYEAILLGADGWVSMAANVFPDVCAKMVNLMFEKKYKEAWDVYMKLLPFLAHLEDYGNSKQALKYAITRRGRNLGVCRQPFLPISEEQMKVVDKAIEGLL